MAAAEPRMSAFAVHKTQAANESKVKTRSNKRKSEGPSKTSAKKIAPTNHLIVHDLAEDKVLEDLVEPNGISDAEYNDISDPESSIMGSFRPDSRLSMGTASIISQTSKPVSACGNMAADNAFKWLIHPMTAKHFYKNIFEQTAYHFKREVNTYNSGLFSTEEFNTILKQNRLFLGKEMDILKYEGGERIPLKYDHVLSTDVVWKNFKDGYSIRMRNPHVYHKNLGKLCALLQEFFSSSVGANMYLTPADCQGFPPHYDDIDAFILQIEGKKHWRVYYPRKKSQMLPRDASGDLIAEQLGEPDLSVDLLPGDMLYLPRGFVHQAKAVGQHSLHITVSTNQLNTWADFIEKGLPMALSYAADKMSNMRKSLPKDYYDIVGVAYNEANEDNPERISFVAQVQKFLFKVVEHFPIDEVADLHAESFLQASMPPNLFNEDKQNSIHGNGHKLLGGVVVPGPKLTLDSKIRWIKKRAVRLVIDDGGTRLLHTFNNSKNSNEDKLSSIDIQEEAIPAAVRLFNTHPAFLQVKDLPCLPIIKTENSGMTRLEFAELLYENGLLTTK